MDTIVSLVLSGVLAAIARLIEDVEDVAADLFTTGDDPATLRAAYVATARALSAHRGHGNRVTVTFPADTPGGDRFGHRLASYVLDGGTEETEMPDTARITDHNGMCILSW